MTDAPSPDEPPRRLQMLAAGITPVVISAIVWGAGRLLGYPADDALRFSSFLACLMALPTSRDKGLRHSVLVCWQLSCLACGFAGFWLEQRL